MTTTRTRIALAALATLAFAPTPLMASGGPGPRPPLPPLPSNTSQENATRWAQGKMFNVTFRSAWGSWAFARTSDMVEFYPTNVRGQAGPWATAFERTLQWRGAYGSLVRGTTCNFNPDGRWRTIPCTDIDNHLQKAVRSARVEFWGIYDGDRGFRIARANVML